MDTWFFFSVVAAVIVGNAASFAFFMAAMRMSRLQKKGVKDDEFPWWVYVCFLAPLGLAGWGVSLLT